MVVALMLSLNFCQHVLKGKKRQVDKGLAIPSDLPIQKWDQHGCGINKGKLRPENHPKKNKKTLRVNCTNCTKAVKPLPLVLQKLQAIKFAIVLFSGFNYHGVRFIPVWTFIENLGTRPPPSSSPPPPPASCAQATNSALYALPQSYSFAKN
jgi:hypothetical protein